MRHLSGFNIFSIVVLCFIIGLPGCSTRTTEPDEHMPSKPTGLSVLGSDGEVFLTWDANSESDLAGYHIYRTDSIDVDENYQRVETVSSTTTTYTDIGLEYTTKYYYKISAFDDATNEGARSDAVSITPFNQNSPERPQELKIQAHNINFEGIQLDIKLTWDSNTESDLAGYNIYRDTTNNFPHDSTHFVVKVTSAAYTDTDVAVGKQYYYAIRAVDKGDFISNPASGTDIPLPPAQLVLPGDADTTNTTPTFVWNDIDVQTSLNVRYKIFITNSRLGGDVIEPVIVSDTTFAIGSSSPLPLGTLYWRIGTITNDENDINSNTSTREFTVQ